jgi:hypothetical protein
MGAFVDGSPPSGICITDAGSVKPAETSDAAYPTCIFRLAQRASKLIQCGDGGSEIAGKAR